ncbi:MAG: 1-acyl-sn-glycerol-3-phosphate acyltransferase [Chitinophagaceae bacterium]|nr:1-acyl-sn-glycerol-3-phosphate acyltransferase [Chitinophagaceae bacterium]
MKYVLWPFQIIYCLYGLLTFVLIMLLVLPFVVAGSFLGEIKGGNFIYKVCNVWGDIWYALVGMRDKNIYEVPHDTSGKYIFVANHISYMDIPPVVMSIKQPIRVLGKYEMVHYPVFGYIYKCAVILVDRRDTERRAQSVRHLKDVLAKHISILIFPEGTFNTTGQPLKEFYDGAFRIAIETQTPLKPLLFIDSIDRLHYSSIFTLSPGPNRVVYLQEVPVEGLTLKDVPVLKQNVYNMMDTALRKYRTY